MNTLSFLLLFAVATPTGIPATAPLSTAVTVTKAADPLLTNSRTERHHLTVRLANLQAQRATIVLETMDGSQLISQRSVRGRNGYAITFDMEALDNGRYVVSVKKGDTVRRQVVRKDAAGVRCSDWL